MDLFASEPTESVHTQVQAEASGPSFSAPVRTAQLSVYIAVYIADFYRHYGARVRHYGDGRYECAMDAARPVAIDRSSRDRKVLRPVLRQEKRALPGDRWLRNAPSLAT